jgi:hypothetical protein
MTHVVLSPESFLCAIRLLWQRETSGSAATATTHLLTNGKHITLGCDGRQGDVSYQFGIMGLDVAAG